MGFTRHYRALIIALMVAANVLILAAVAYSLDLSRRQHESRASTLTQNIAVAVDQSLSNTIGRIDLVLRATCEELERQLAAGRIDPPTMERFISLQEARLPELDAIRVADARGLVILGKGLNRSEQPSWADRDYFVTLREHADAGLQISKPRLGRVAKKYIIGFARRYNRPDGGFAGVVSAPLAVDRIDELLAHYDLGSGGSVVLRDADLGLIARHPPLPHVPAGFIGNSAVSTELRNLVGRGVDETTYHAASASDSRERTVSLRRLKPGRMLVLASLATEDYLADWRQERKTKLGLYSCFAVLSLLSAVFLIRLMTRILSELEERQRREDAERRRRASHQRLNELATTSSPSLDVQLRQALGIGTQHLGLEFGIVGETDGGVYRIVVQVSPPGTLGDGQEFALADTLCQLTLAAGRVVAIPDVGQSDHAGHARDSALGLAAYIGAPVSVDGAVVGSVGFGSSRVYPRPFDEGDIEFVDLLARWTGSAMERDRAQKRLAASETHLHSIVETEPECVKVVAADGSLLQMNRAGLDIIEADTMEQVVGRSVYDLVTPEWRAEYIRLNQRVLAGEPANLEFEIVGLRGGRRWLDTHAVPLRDGEGRITAQLAVTRDVTARRQAETALREAMRKAEAANVAKSQFLATMSHEIRTPLNGILGMAQLLMMPDLTEEERLDYTRTILSSGQTLLTLLNDILDLSKVDAGKLRLSSEVFDPLQLLRETAALHREAAQSKAIALDVAWRGAEGRRYWGDPVRLRQMLSNLVSNAIKFTDRGGVRVEASEVDGKDAGDAGQALLAFVVSDTGMGIAADQQSLLFQPFTQLDGSATRRHGGTGLGLSIVRQLAELMGGSVGVDSAPGKGASFHFTVRVVPAGTGPAPDCPPPAPAWEAAAGPAPCILVAEDNETNRIVVETLLVKQGCRVVTAADGRVAVDMVTSGRTRPDLVLMDCQMPEMNGFDATRAIRAWEREHGRTRLPIVALTAGAFAEDRAQCLEAGMDDFLAKPVDLADMALTLEKWL